MNAETSDLSCEALLQRVTDLGRELTGASYGAVGIWGEGNGLSRLITSGLSQGVQRHIGTFPSGWEFLRTVRREGKVLWFADISKRLYSVGFPFYHPHTRELPGSAPGAQWPSFGVPLLDGQDRRL